MTFSDISLSSENETFMKESFISTNKKNKQGKNYMKLANANILMDQPYIAGKYGLKKDLFLVKHRLRD